MGTSQDVELEGLDEEEGEISDDEAMDGEDEGPWFSMGNTKEEK